MKIEFEDLIDKFHYKKHSDEEFYLILKLIKEDPEFKEQIELYLMMKFWSAE